MHFSIKQIVDEFQTKGTPAHRQAEDIRGSMGRNVILFAPDSQIGLQGGLGNEGHIKVINKLSKWLGVTFRLVGDHMRLRIGDGSGHVYLDHFPLTQKIHIEVLPYEVKAEQYKSGGSGREFLLNTQEFFNIPCEAEAIEKTRHFFALNINGRLVISKY